MKWPCTWSEGWCRCWCCHSSCGLSQTCQLTRCWLGPWHFRLSRSWCLSYLESWCRCVCSPAEVRQTVWATRIIKVGAFQAVSCRGTFGFMFVASGSSQVHPSFLPPKRLPCGHSMQTEAAGLHRLCSELLQLGKVRSLQQISLLYHFWWFCFSMQTLTDTNGCLCVPWREFRILMNLCSQSNLTLVFS